MPSGSPWVTTSAPNSSSRSLFSSLRKLSNNDSGESRRSHVIANYPPLNTDKPPTARSFRGSRDSMNPFSPESYNDIGRRGPSPSPSPLANPYRASSQSGGPGPNAFPASANEPPPAYTPSDMAANGPAFSSEAHLEFPAPAAPEANITSSTGGEDPYTFLSTFDTVLLVDDSGSMAGRGWREVSQALAVIAPIVTKHDSDGIDVYFLNHKSTDSGVPTEGIAPTGYRSIKRAETISDIFNRVRPQGGTPTGMRVHHILKPYLAKLEKAMEEGKEAKPLNLIVITDGVPSDDVESILISAAKKLDKLEAPPFQVGVQFFQVGNEQGAKEALEELDDELSNMVGGGIRDIVDTVTWTGGQSASEGGIGLTGDGVLKAVLGAVVKRLDRRQANGDIRRR